LKQQANHAALYCRLSRDDGGDAESNSIQTQRSMLQRYAREQAFIVREEHIYIDDGISGTTFERPSFKRMIADIEEGKVKIVLCKDLSRLGRNNALVAFYTEIFFIDHDVRFIALNDGIDSAKGDNEIMPFKSVINEYYARDISKKVRSAIRTRAINGEHHAGKAPYGYLKNPQDRRKLIVDHEVAPVVQQMFQMYADGLSSYAIAKHFFEQRIPTPSGLDFLRTGKIGKGVDPERPWDWRSYSVDTILKNPCYLGHMVSGRQTTKSFKNPTVVKVPQEDWIIVEGTHEALISEELFEKVQRLTKTKVRTNNLHGTNMFAGLLKCADCGRNMAYSSTREMRGGEGGFNCGGQRHSYRAKDGDRCSGHNIPYKGLREAVLANLRMVLAASFDPEDFLQHVEQGHEDTSEDDKKAIVKLKQRDSQLRVLTRRIFEQNASGSISDETFAELYSGYQDEQKSIAGKIAALEEKLAGRQVEQSNTDQFLALAQPHREIPELTRDILVDFIEKIVVHEGTGYRFTRKQEIDIYYRFVGKLGVGIALF